MDDKAVPLTVFIINSSTLFEINADVIAEVQKDVQKSQERILLINSPQFFLKKFTIPSLKIKKDGPSLFFKIFTKTENKDAIKIFIHQKYRQIYSQQFYQLSVRVYLRLHKVLFGVFLYCACCLCLKH